MTEIVQQMISTMTHRGPDAGGVWTDPTGRCVLGHRRLSIIDTSDAGRQPMASGDGHLIMTFNGEIYNFQELGPALQRAGVRLRGRTDTEVLIEALALWGADAFPKLDGMFAFGAFNTQTGDMWLARDPFGEKPLYYMELSGGGLAFASELRALEGVPGFDRTVDIDAMAEVLSFQYIGAPRSIYRAVKKLPPAHWLRIDSSGRIETGRYFEFRPGRSGFTDQSLPELTDQLEDILVRSIRGRLIADVPLGAFLSGGVDSSMVCALIRRKLDRPVMTFSTGFQDAPESEHLTARAFAKHLGTDHHEEILTPNASEFLFDIGKILDEPNADSSCLPTYLLSRFARKHVTVAVSGDGGDEMFGGYGRYFATLDELPRHRAGDLPDWKPGSVYFGNRILVSVEPHIEELFGFVPDGFANHLGRLRGELNDAEHRLLCEMRRSDVDNYMPGAVLAKVDRMSMRHSLEVRTPYLNVELARFAERLPDSVLVRNGRGKIVLRELAYRYLPRELVDLPKQGFGLPMSDWARASLLDVAGKLVESGDSRLKSAFGGAAIARFMTRQRTPGQFSAYQVWALAMLESWFRHHPVKIPSVAEERRAQRRSKPIGKPRDNALDVIPIADGNYLVVGRTEEHAFGPVLDGLLQILPPGLALDALHLLNDDQGEKATHPNAMQLPGWGVPLSSADLVRLAKLRGSTLLFAEREHWFHFDFAECLKFRSLGVKRLILQNPYADGECQAIELRAPTRNEHVRNLVKLLSHRVGMISKARWAALLGAIPFVAATDGYNVTKVIKKIDPIPDRELSSSFMLFEGGRQLPPMQVSHRDIAERGKGRYSIWNQALFFSPTEEHRLHTRPYWIVPLNAQTEPLLQMVPRSLRPQRKSDAAAQALEPLFTDAEAPPLTLRPGDPVVVCTHALPPGGAERQWVYLAQALSEAGYQVTFVTYQPLDGHNGHYLSVLERLGIPVVDASQVSISEEVQRWPRTPRAMAILRSDLIPQRDRLIKLTAVFLSLRPKAVFSQLDHPNVLGGFAGFLADVPRIVMSFRNYNPTHFDYINQSWYLPGYQLLSRLKRVLFSGNNHAANADYADWIGIPHERVAYIPNAIEPSMFPVPTEEQLARGRADLGVDKDTPIILGVFRLSAEKDPLTFIDVCERVIRQIPATRVFIVGVGSLHDRLNGRIIELGLGSQITLLGRRSDVNVLMSISNLFLLTSLKEGMPNVLMEAQLMGTPIVATRSGGTPDVMVEGVTGMLCAIGDVDGLAAACLELLRDDARARAMGEAGRRHIATSFPKEQLGRRYVALLQGEHEPRSVESTCSEKRVDVVNINAA